MCGIQQTDHFDDISMKSYNSSEGPIMQAQMTFGICAVHYANEYIAMVQAIPDAEDSEATPVELSREALVDAIRSGTKFVTLHKQADGRWGHWDAATLIPVAGTAYVKLFDDEYALDDLGDLPEY